MMFQEEVETVEASSYLLKHLLQLGLHHDHALTIAGVPDVRQIVDALAPADRELPTITTTENFPS